METIPRATSPVPSITTAVMVEVDRAMIQDCGISLPQMMEHAGRHLATLARLAFLGGDPRGRHVVVLAGPGGNGGGALIGARRLHSWGVNVTVVLGAEPEHFAEAPRHQLETNHRVGVSVAAAVPDLGAPLDLILDGLIGYSLHGSPRGRIADLIRWANQSPAPILSLDVPSGMDSTTGEVLVPTIIAEATLTLALPKTGLQAATANVGALYLGDIGVPPVVYRRLGIEGVTSAIFANGDLLRLG